MCYISSNANRIYATAESAYGRVGELTAQDRFPAVKLSTTQELVRAERKDKSGSRTYTGAPAGGRRQTSWELRTYMMGWGDQTRAPGYGPLFQAGLGADPLLFAGGTAAAGCSETQLYFGSAVTLQPGQAIVYAGEIRFVTALPDSHTVQLNAPLSVIPAAGAPIGPTLTYRPATYIPSATIYDYWSPVTAVQRLLCGSAVDKLRIEVNGDFHEFIFSGMAQDLIDSCTFQSNLGQLESFPQEPAADLYDFSVIPGHLGQAWLGSTQERFYTLTSAVFQLDNDLDMRAREFGSTVPRCVVPGRRAVTLDFDLYEQDDDATRGLYQAARQQSPIGVMLQLGQQDGQLCGVYMNSVLPEVPSFEDGEPRLQWRFRNARAQGAGDDEVVIAFG